MDKLEFLTGLATYHGTDKLGHGYMPHYANHLPDKCRAMLEIGVAKAKSAHVWNDFYGEDELELSLVDLFEDPDHVSQRYCWNRGWRTHKGDASNYDFLYTIKDQFDVIIEDASHNSYDQIISFKHLFQNNLKSGGLWVTEDLHCCTDPFYRQKADVKFDETLLSVFNQYKETGSLRSRFFDDVSYNEESECRMYERLIKTVNVYDNKIAFITKK